MLALTSYIIIHNYRILLYTAIHLPVQLLGWLERHHFPLVSFFIPTRRLRNQIYACAEIVSPTPLLVFAHMDCFPCLI